MLTHRQLLHKLRTAGELGFNVLMEGPHGTGKTSLVQQVAAELGLRMKYYSASTLDPFVDLVGLPVPVAREEGRRTLEFHRPGDLDDAQLVFFDELNRAHTKVLNAVLEMIQFRTINGEPLPHLKAVFAACNPSDGEYQVTDLDPALVDRFHMHLKFGMTPDRAWFEEQYGATGKALCDWWNTDLEAAQRLLVSPRKLEHMAQFIVRDCDPEDTVPDRKIGLPFHLLRERLDNPHRVTDAKDFAANPDAYLPLVQADADMAQRFLHVLPLMKPQQLNAVRMLLLVLPAELLASVHKNGAFMKRLYKAIATSEGAAESNAFRELVEEMLRVS